MNETKHKPVPAWKYVLKGVATNFWQGHLASILLGAPRILIWLIGKALRYQGNKGRKANGIEELGPWGTGLVGRHVDLEGVSLALWLFVSLALWLFGVVTVLSALSALGMRF